jgi:p-hydroxybenzoate 3-monooxygenase
VTIYTQVAIVGAGPAGSLLSHLLALEGIDSVIVERQSRAHVLSRVRAGVLEWGTVEVLRNAGVGERMDRDGHIHNGTSLVWAERNELFIDIKKHADTQFMSYGQTMIQEDLYDALAANDAAMFFDVSDLELHDIATDKPSITFSVDGAKEQIAADYIAGCDGYHGPSRKSIPDLALRTYERSYPFGWLGILSETPPLSDVTYCQHERGFALASQRNPMLSRYYLQCPLDDAIEDWPDDRFWSELTARFGIDIGGTIVTGPSIEKSIAPVRSFVAEPLRFGNLFLAGDAAHVVPPTGAKGLNLAVSDVHYLARGLVGHYRHGDNRDLDAYSEVALRRVWSAVRFSWWLTGLLHRFPDHSAFDHRMQEAELNHLASSERAQAAMCEQYAGLPFEPSLISDSP